MKAIILAAGRGSRMKAETEDKPKCLTVLAGKPLLQWQIDALKGAGIDEIGIVRGYLAEKLSMPGIRAFENPRWDKTNMVVSLSCASSWLQRDACIVSYSDIVYPARTVKGLREGAGDIVITYDLDWLRLWSLRFTDPLADAETFRVDAGGRLLEIGERAKSLGEIKGQYMGLLKITPAGWETIEGYLSGIAEDRRDRLDVTALLKELLREGVEINTVPVKGGWYEVDNENDLELYRRIAYGSDGRLWHD